MDNNEYTNQKQNSDVYHATSNLNTAMENPQFNVNSAMSINVQNDDNVDSKANNKLDYSQYSPNSFNNYKINTQNITYEPVVTNSYQNSKFNDKDSIDDDEISKNNESYEPVMEAKKAPKGPFKVPAELMTLVFIVIILLVFVLLMPGIYDFFRNLRLVVR